MLELLFGFDLVQLGPRKLPVDIGWMCRPDVRLCRREKELGRQSP